jgi:major vault protein
MSSNLVRIPPFTYIHILDNNTNITRIEIGPATYVKKENETIVLGPK